LQPDERSARFVSREARGLRRELSIEPLVELGLVAMDSPNDPVPSLVVEDGRVVELDGRREQEWDALDHFVARYGLDVDVAAEVAELEDVEIARRLVDVGVPRDELTGSLGAGDRIARSGRVDVRAEEAARAAHAGEPGARDEPQGEPGTARR
jgi:propanediol dehydratase large subunit